MAFRRAITAWVLLAFCLAGPLALAQDAPATKKYAVEYHHEFRGDALPDWLTILRDREGQFVTFEKDGLRVTLPKERDSVAGVGLRPLVNIGGDFELTIAFSILDADEPAPDSWGFGVSMRIEKRDSPEAATIARLKRAKGTQVVFWDRMILVNGKPKYEGRPRPCPDQTLRLRLQRTGPALHFLWAPGTTGGAFQSLKTVDNFGAEDLKPVGINVMTAKESARIEARLFSIDIKSGGVADPAAPAPPLRENAAPRTPSSGSLALVLLLGFGFTAILALGLGAWIYLRQRREPAERPAPVVKGKGTKR